MENRSNSKVTEFIIIGFSDVPELYVLLFVFFLSVYMLTLVGNFLLILVICSSPTLYTPMYFLLCNLSLLEIVYTSVSSPEQIHIIVTSNGSVSFKKCMAQLYFFIAFGSTEYFLLTIMSFDRYVAVCRPLHYTLIMNKRVCILGAASTWLGGFLASVPITTVSSNLNYCSSNIVNHIFCDIAALTQISCGDKTVIRNIILGQGVVLVMTSFMLTITSYVHIILTIVKIQSLKGKYKAFSTCASHLTIVSLFYFLVFLLYMRPESAISLNQGKILVVLYAYLIPLLNPIVYSFRNKDVKLALRKMLLKMKLDWL
ncbi:hypothetical protein GDO86_006719 [Hymenochirus boettgeri]|uniref:Olfactory receptor n=1 Tax=Hymenochirus boettgeri TaxID=247094 RepID=A0A8T2J7B1_9PIPI|nr:hypothetical protein GDO86_006719 [Hymenochirus boettgeri]